MSKKVLILEGLCCANCATKIEHQVKNLSEVKDAFVDFVNKKLIIETKSEGELETVIDEAKKIVNKIEPDVRVIIEETKKDKASKHEFILEGHG